MLSARQTGQASSAVLELAALLELPATTLTTLGVTLRHDEPARKSRHRLRQWPILTGSFRVTLQGVCCRRQLFGQLLRRKDLGSEARGRRLAVGVRNQQATRKLVEATSG